MKTKINHSLSVISLYNFCFLQGYDIIKWTANTPYLTRYQVADLHIYIKWIVWLNLKSLYFCQQVKTNNLFLHWRELNKTHLFDWIFSWYFQFIVNDMPTLATYNVSLQYKIRSCWWFPFTNKVNFIQNIYRRKYKTNDNDMTCYVRCICLISLSSLWILETVSVVLILSPMDDDIHTLHKNGMHLSENTMRRINEERNKTKIYLTKCSL